MRETTGLRHRLYAIKYTNYKNLSVTVKNKSFCIIFEIIIYILSQSKLNITYFTVCRRDGVKKKVGKVKVLGFHFHESRLLYNGI